MGLPDGEDSAQSFRSLPQLPLRCQPTPIHSGGVRKSPKFFLTQSSLCSIFCIDRNWRNEVVKLSPAVEGFILHWGEMGTKWGINRTVAQIHALLYLSPDPLNAEQIAETLGVARSNVSNSLRELQGWGIVKVQHVMGDRRDHYESMKDVWGDVLSVSLVNNDTCTPRARYC